MRVENIKIYDDLAWDDYLRLPAASFSGLKDIKIEETYGMRIGKLVHTYILKPKEYNYEEADIVIPIARELIKAVGHNLLLSAMCEKPITADFIVDDFLLKWKGIPDMFLHGLIVIDFKVLAGSLENAVQRFNYPNQLRGYMLPTAARQGLLMGYNRAKKRVEHLWVQPDAAWWKAVVISRGDVIV